MPDSDINSLRNMRLSLQDAICLRRDMSLRDKKREFISYRERVGKSIDKSRFGGIYNDPGRSGFGGGS